MTAQRHEPERAASAGPVLSRRRLLRLLPLLGGAAVLQACGGGNQTGSVRVASAPTAPATGAATVAATSGRGPVASPATVGMATGTPPGGAATPRPGGSPAASPPRPASPRPSGAATDLRRMLALVPRHETLPGRNGVWFADSGRQKRNYGFERVDSYAAFQALPAAERTRFNNTIGRAPHSDAVGRQYAQQLREVTGYDYWQVDREIYAGDPPGVWSRLEGRFDNAAIERTLTGSGYTTTAYQGRAILSRGGDYELSLQHPVSRLMLARLNRVALDQQGFAAAPASALIEAGIDAQAGSLPSLAADPDHAALAAALGPVVGAALLLPDQLYQQPAPGPTDPNRARLRPYRLVGLGLLDDGTTHTTLIALSYAQPADAEAVTPVLRQRLADYRLQRTGQPLRDRATPAEPRVVAAGERAVVVAPLAIAAEVDLWLWVELLAQRDLGFLAE